MKILYNHYHSVLKWLGAFIEIMSVSLWLIMIVEFLNTGSIIHTASVIIMLYGSIMVIFALLSYIYEINKQN